MSAVSMDSILGFVNGTSMCHYSGQKPRPNVYRGRLYRNDDIIKFVFFLLSSILFRDLCGV